MDNKLLEIILGSANITTMSSDDCGKCDSNRRCNSKSFSGIDYNDKNRKDQGWFEPNQEKPYQKQARECNQKYCNHKWKITQGLSQKWKDCTKCGVKYEDWLKLVNKELKK